MVFLVFAIGMDATRGGGDHGPPGFEKTLLLLVFSMKNKKLYISFCTLAPLRK